MLAVRCDDTCFEMIGDFGFVLSGAQLKIERPGNYRAIPCRLVATTGIGGRLLLVAIANHPMRATSTCKRAALHQRPGSQFFVGKGPIVHTCPLRVIE